MPKVLWVALPLLLALVMLAALAWRGRAPSRRAVNIVSSLLLLGYAAATAGLGIFWVANQQLPVFDWHYLFGYGTVLLIGLHLVFNLPVVWRFLKRRHGQRRVPLPTAQARRALRRPVLAALGGGAAASAASFWLGWRLARSGVAATQSPAVAAAAPGLATVEHFHAATSHLRRALLRPSPGVDWGDAPPPFKQLPNAPRAPLPAPGSARAGEAVLATLCDLLWHTAGVTQTRGGLLLRASPSSGALFSTELYLLVDHWPGLAPGVWHHHAGDHALDRIQAASGAPGAPSPSATLVATAIFRRTGRKYGERTYRYVLADLGHALENLRVVAAELQVPLQWLTTFDGAALTRRLQLDPLEEGVLAVAVLGGGPVSPMARVHMGPDAASAAVPTEPAAVQPPGLTGQIHAASTRWPAARAAVPAAAQPAPALAGPSRPLPRPALPTSPWRPLIAARRSVRRYTDAPLPLPALAAVLLRMADTGPQWSGAVRIDVVAHAVQGLPAGAYRYDALHHALQPRRTQAPRDASRATALQQDVIGDAAAVCVLSIDRASFTADPRGPAHGYRHAFLEAGMVGERAYLEGQVRGLGVCAVGAFYDDEAALLVGLDPAREWPLHFIALGLPA
jgi:SagB-type dehydrogenase family enzyme